MKRARDGGAPVRRDELVAVLGAGCARDDVRRALEPLGAGALDLLDGVGEEEVKRRR